MRSVAKAFLRYMLRRKGLSALQLFGIACGIAAAVGMTCSSRAALSSFSRAVDFLMGRATHTMERPAGPIEETLLAGLARDPSVRAFSPVIDRKVLLEDGRAVRLLGVDPLLDRAIRPRLAAFRRLPSARRAPQASLSFLLEDDTVWVDENLARQRGLEDGEMIRTSKGDLRVLGRFPNPSGEPLILMDIANAQRLYGLLGRVDRVDLILSDERGFRSRWDTGFTIRSGGQRKAAFMDMVRAFRLNLEALSLLALFVGVYLVYNTAMFAVVSRRKDAGILRSLGVHRREIAAAFLIEILILGALGGGLGGVLGFFLSRLLMDVLGGTISSLYFFLEPSPLPWSWWIPAAGAAGGWAASFLGGIFPIIELMRADPIRAVHGRVPDSRGWSGIRGPSLAGTALVGASVLLLHLDKAHVYVGFASAFALLMGASLLTGLGLVALSPMLKASLGLVGGLPGRVAASNLRRNPGRTSVAVAAFMVALSMSLGLGSMIGSFRNTLVWWMDAQLRGDLYIAPSREVQVPEALYRDLQSVDGIAGLDPYRNVEMDYRGKRIRLSAVDAAVLQRFTRFGWLKGGNENWDPVKDGAVVVSESFARRFGKRAGDVVTLESVRGPVRLKVAAVFYDYTTEHGLVMMDRSTYIKLYNDHTIDSLVVFLDRSVSESNRLLEEIKRRAGRLGLPVAEGAQFHQRILRVFDATFAVTKSMRWMAVIVAFLGIAGALLTLFMERQREFGVYRALGFSTSQVAAMTLAEGLGMGLSSFLLSTAVGTVLAWVLIQVINLRSFHWTVFYHPELLPYATAAAVAVLASLGAAAYPIWRVARIYPQMQIREE